MVTAVDLEDEGLGVFPRAGCGTPGDRPLGGGDSDRLRRAIEEVDLDDEALMDRRRGDGDGLTDESEEEGERGEEEEDEEEGGAGSAMGEPSEAMKGPSPGFFPGDDGDPGSSRAAFFGGSDLDGFATGSPPAGGKPAAHATERHRHRKRGSELGGGKADGDEAEVSPRHSRGGGKAAGDRRKGEPRETAVAAAAGQAEAAEATAAGEEGEGEEDRWWSLRAIQREDGSRWWSPAPEEGEEEESGPSWWPRRKSGSGDGGGVRGAAAADRKYSGGGDADDDEIEEEPRWSAARSLFAQAVSAFSSVTPDTGPSPPSSPPRTKATGAEAANAYCGTSESGSEGAPGNDGGGRGGEGGGGVSPKGGAEKPRVLLESPFFCKGNGTEGLRVVLGNPDLRAGFKQASLVFRARVSSCGCCLCRC